MKHNPMGDIRLCLHRAKDTARLIADMKPGTFLAWEWIVMQSGQKTKGPKHSRFIQKIRAILSENYGVFLKTEPGKGFHVCNFDESLDFCRGYYDLGIRNISKAVHLSMHIREDGPAIGFSERSRLLEARQGMITKLALLMPYRLPEGSNNEPD